jgi:hypothetical protein
VRYHRTTMQNDRYPISDAEYKAQLRREPSASVRLRAACTEQVTKVTADAYASESLQR